MHFGGEWAIVLTCYECTFCRVQNMWHSATCMSSVIVGIGSRVLSCEFNCPIRIQNFQKKSDLMVCLKKNIMQKTDIYGKLVFMAQE